MCEYGDHVIVLANSCAYGVYEDGEMVTIFSRLFSRCSCGVCMYIKKYIDTHIHTYAHTYIHTHIHTYALTHSHTHTHTHTQLTDWKDYGRPDSGVCGAVVPRQVRAPHRLLLLLT